jgi:RecA/RadA recombinase
MSDSKDLLKAFDKFNDLFEKKTKTHVKLKGFSDITEFIPTGNYMLNALMSGSLFGGYPNTRSIGIAGDSGTGKSFLCMNAVREAQKCGYVVFYVDTEGALDTSDFEKFGVDLNMLKYVRLGVVSEVKFFMNDLIKTAEEAPGLKILVIVDSLGMLETDKEVADIEKGKSANDMGLRAKELRSLFKSFTLDLSNLKIPFLFTNHTGATMDQYTPKAQSGGAGPQYAASVVLMLSKTTLWDESSGAKVRTGVICRATTDKNRLAKPDKVELHISFHKGMNPYVGLHLLPFDFENCGVGRGNKFTEKEFSKVKDDKEKYIPFEVNGEKFYFLPKATARNYILRHSGEEVPLRQLFSEKVWTQDALKELDKNVVIPKYKYSTVQDVLDEEENDLTQVNDDDDTSGSL